jgi:hypothetical protein
MKKLCALIGLASFLLLTTGCVTGHRMVSLTPPTAAHPAAKGSASLSQVKDCRQFENKPSSPWIPSIKGDVNAVSREQLGQYIGRQRNTYGKAMGDIMLPEGQTVEGCVRDLVAEALARRGYAVADAKGDATFDVQVKIGEFWAWCTPGMWSIPFESRLYCEVVIRRGDKESKFNIQAQGNNPGQVASDANWREAYRRAFDDFLLQLDGVLSREGL